MLPVQGMTDHSGRALMVGGDVFLVPVKIRIMGSASTATVKVLCTYYNEAFGSLSYVI